MNQYHTGFQEELERAAESLEFQPSYTASLEQQLQAVAFELDRETSPTFGQEAICSPGPGIPNSRCSIYAANAWWLPLAYVNNATCACQSTPNTPTANCVRQFLQRRLATTPAWVKRVAAANKPLEIWNYPAYQAFVQGFLTPRIYRDHVDAYRACCCRSGPAPYPAWIGVTTVPIRPCSLVGQSIRQFGSCSGIPGTW